VLVSQSGPDHKKVFEIEVSINDSPVARASASSKKSAETKAARLALATLEDENSDKIQSEKKTESTISRKK
jgi:ribonuclease-3